MPRPDLISQEYITPVSVTNVRLFGPSHSNGSARSDLVYSDLRPKPLSCRRKRFIVTNVGFVAGHLCAMVVLVIYMTVHDTVHHPVRRYASSQGCELCDLWCTSNCSRLTRYGDRVLPQTVNNINETHSGRSNVLCCVKRRDMLSTNYEYLQRQQSKSGGSDSLVEKVFDGIRLKDKWIEDFNWPKCNNTVIEYEKTHRLFKITADGTFSVHSRIDFSCLYRNRSTEQKLEIDTRTSNEVVFVDDRAHLGQSNSILDGTVVFTSTVNVIVKLQAGNSLKFVTVPSECASPRSLVVFRSNVV